MNNTFLLSTLILSLIACREDKTKDNYEIPQLSQTIEAFIDSKDNFRKDSSILLVNLDISNDTLELVIADTYPNVEKLQFRCDTMLHGYRVIFTGEKIKGYYKIEPSQSDFPEDIIKINSEEKWRLWNDFSSWLFLYRDGKLIYQDLGGKIE